MATAEELGETTIAAPAARGGSYRSVVVPVDGSGLGRKALPIAFEIAAAASATVHILHIKGSKVAPVTGRRPSAKQAERVAFREDEKLAEDPRLSSKVSLRYEVSQGDVAEEVAGLANRLGSSIIILACRVYRSLRRSLGKGTAERIVRAARVPVILVPVDYHLRSDPPRSIGERMLVALDGSPGAERVLDDAVLTARTLRADLHLAMSVEPPIVPVVAGPGAMGPGLALIPVAAANPRKDRAALYLERVAGTLRSRELTVRTDVLENTRPARAIAVHAQELGAGCVAMATRAREGVRRLAGGSHVAEVLAQVTLPTLTVGPSLIPLDQRVPRQPRGMLPRPRDPGSLARAGAASPGEGGGA